MSSSTRSVCCTSSLSGWNVADKTYGRAIDNVVASSAWACALRLNDDMPNFLTRNCDAVSLAAVLGCYVWMWCGYRSERTWNQCELFDGTPSAAHESVDDAMKRVPRTTQCAQVTLAVLCYGVHQAQLQGIKRGQYRFQHPGRVHVGSAGVVF